MGQIFVALSECLNFISAPPTPIFFRPSYGPASTMPYTALTQRARPDYFSSSFYLVRVWCKIMVETKKNWWFFSFLQDTEETLIVVFCKKRNHLTTEICTILFSKIKNTKIKLKLFNNYERINFHFINCLCIQLKQVWEIIEINHLMTASAFIVSNLTKIHKKSEIRPKNNWARWLAVKKIVEIVPTIQVVHIWISKLICDFLWHVRRCDDEKCPLADSSPNI